MIWGGPGPSAIRLDLQRPARRRKAELQRRYMLELQRRSGYRAARLYPLPPLRGTMRVSRFVPPGSALAPIAP